MAYLDSHALAGFQVECLINLAKCSLAEASDDLVALIKFLKTSLEDVSNVGCLLISALLHGFLIYLK